MTGARDLPRTPARDREEAGIVAGRGGENLPFEFKPAKWDGHRSVRVSVGGREIGLATTAYSYLLTDAEKVEAAYRLAALWTLAARRRWTTEQIIASAERTDR